MARSLFGGGPGDQVFGEILLGHRTVYGEVTDDNGDAAAVTLTVWSAKTGGSQLTDLLDAAGAAATTVVTSVGDGLIPQFQGPDAVTTVWVSPDSGATRFRLFAATGGGGGGSGDVVGPALSVSGNLPSFGNTTGKLLSDSGLAASAIALTSSPLSQFAATTSAQLRGVLSDETGTGSAVFATSPTLVTPALGTPTSLTLTNATGLPAAGIGSGTIATARLGSGTPDVSKFLRGDQTWNTPALDSMAGQLALNQIASGTADQVLVMSDDGADVIWGDVAVESISATGTPSATTYLRGDGTWSVLPVAIKPEQYGAVGDGVADDTTAVTAAFTAANALRQPVIGGNVYAPGATVVLEGKYKLTTLAATIVASCNIDGARGSLIAPTAFAAAVLTLGHETSGSILQTAAMTLPSITKTGPPTSFTAGSIGVKTQNIYDSVIVGRRVEYFETAWLFTGLGQGTAYNTINLGRVDLCKVAHKIAPAAASWVNQNIFSGGGVTQSPNTLDGTGIRRTGWRHLVIDGSAGSGTVNGNTFNGISYEGDLSELYFDIKHASNNVWQGACRFEQGTAARAVTLATDTFTDVAHGLAVGDMVVFFASVTLAGGMLSGEAYWVQAVPTADTFKVAATKGGTAVTFTTNGSGLTYYTPPRIRFDGTGGSTYANEIKDPNYSWPGQLDVRNVNAPSANAVAPSLPRRGSRMPGRNRIMNGDFRVNQRGYVSGTGLALDVFCFDRWKSFQAATTVTFTSAPQGQMVALNGYISQVIERAELPAGTYTLSWDGTASGRIYPVGAGLPSLAAGPITVDLDGTTDVRVDFFGSGEHRLGRVQLEAGIVATAFEQESVAAQLVKCKRYFQRLGTGTGGREMIGTGIANATTAAFFPLRLPVEMRTTPTAAVTSGTTFRVNIGTSVILASGSPTLDATSNPRTLRVNASVASGLTVGQVATLDTGDGFFDLSAEL